MRSMLRLGCLLLFLGCFCATNSLVAADTLKWRAKEDRVDAEIQNWDLQTLLSKMAAATGWQIFLEPSSTLTVSVKFKDLTSDQALQRLLGKINYSLTRTNGSCLLYVFKSNQQAATQLVKAEPTKSGEKNYLIANELVVRLKKNSKLSIEELAKLTNAKIVGRDDALNVYRLQFPDEASAKAARDILAGSDSVAWVDSNWSVDRPDPISMTPATASTSSSFDIKPTDGCSRIVGLIDTAVQPQRGFEDHFLPAISVVGDSPLPTDAPTHGTGMGEIIVQNSSAKVLPVGVYRNGESTTTYEVAQGIIKAVNAGANPINLSLGGTGDSEFLHQLIKEASQKGVIFVAAAGNEPVTTSTYPAAWPEVISVTASGPNGAIADYANSGDFIKAMAPGTSTVTYNGQLWQFQGTSVATAVFSGRLAAMANQDCVAPTRQMADQLITRLPVKR